MKYYTVNLYDVKYTEDYRGQVIVVGEVIVKKGLCKAEELLTEHKIEILPKKALDKYGVVEEKYQDREQFERTGYHLAVLEEELVPENISTEKDIDIYVEGFDYSEFNSIYTSIKEKMYPENDKKETLRQKVKAVKGTKK